MDDKSYSEITEEEWARYPVWEFALDSEGEEGRDETWMRPVESLPVSDLSNRLVSVPIRIANGQVFRAVLGNISVKNPRKTRIFIAFTLFLPHRSFYVIRDPASAHGKESPEQLAKVLNLPLSEIFPISYDLTGLAVGHPDVIKDQIPAYPEEKLTEKERMDLIFSDD